MTKHAELHCLAQEWCVATGKPLPTSGTGAYREMFEAWEAVAFATHKLLRIGSHRAYDRVIRLCAGLLLKEQMSFEEYHHYLLVPESVLAEARAIKGVTLAHPKHKLYDCWDMGS
jgi:hypothetical protein